jgi:hypothetical protein
LSAVASRGYRQQSSNSEIALRCLGVIMVLCVGAGCAHDIVMLNPRTGETLTCRASALNPWSQLQACVGDHIAQGWRKLE